MSWIYLHENRERVRQALLRGHVDEVVTLRATAFDELAKRWRPILDHAEDCGTDVCYGEGGCAASLTDEVNLVTGKLGQYAARDAVVEEQAGVEIVLDLVQVRVPADFADLDLLDLPIVAPVRQAVLLEALDPVPVHLEEGVGLVRASTAPVSRAPPLVEVLEGADQQGDDAQNRAHVPLLPEHGGAEAHLS